MARQRRRWNRTSSLRLLWGHAPDGTVLWQCTQCAQPVPLSTAAPVLRGPVDKEDEVVKYDIFDHWAALCPNCAEGPLSKGEMELIAKRVNDGWDYVD